MDGFGHNQNSAPTNSDAKRIRKIPNNNNINSNNNNYLLILKMG